MQVVYKRKLIINSDQFYGIMKTMFEPRCLRISWNFFTKLSFIIFLCPMLEDSCKLSVVKHSILNGSFPVHLIHFIISKPVSNGGQKLPQSVLVDQTSIFLIKAAKCILYDIFWISALKSLTK